MNPTDPSAKPPAAAVETLTRELLAGSRRALGRIITIVENNKPGARDVARLIYPHLGRACVIGVTGPPGAGKSTLVNALIADYRRAGRTVGVVAIDPTSPVSGGSILGDRLRMNTAMNDDGVFVRSLASGGHLGGLSLLTSRVVDALDAAGYERIIVETVGAGQSEVEIASLADLKVVVMVPGLGDDIQAIKAGILEIADILAVNKFDLPGAAQTVAHLRAMLGLRSDGGEGVRLITTSALKGSGVGELIAGVEAMVAGIDEEEKRANRLRRMRRILAQAAAARVRTQILQPTKGDELIDTLTLDVDRGAIGLDRAISQWLSGKLRH